MSDTNFSKIPGTTGKYLSNLELELVSPNVKKIKSELTMRNKSIEWQVNFLKKKLKFWKKVLETSIDDSIIIADPVTRARASKKLDAKQAEARVKIPELENMIAGLVPQIKEELFTETDTNTLVVPPGMWFVCDTIHDNVHLNTTLKPFFLPECRPYQVESLQALYQYNRATVELATGLGKSKIIQSMALAAALSGLRCMIVVPTEYLVGQMLDQMKVLHPNTTAQGGGRQAALGWDILVTTIQSAQMFADVPHTILLDECFPYNQCVQTTTGPIEIGKLHRMRLQNQPLPLVVSYNEKTQTFENKQITNSWKKDDYNQDGLVCIKTGRLKIKCTEDHLFLTTNGWVKAQHLNNDSTILGSFGHSKRSQIGGIVWNDDQYQIMLGSFLGDGSVQSTSKLKQRYRLKVIHGEKQQKYCEWKAQMMGSQIEYIPKNGFKRTPAYKFSTKCFDSDITLGKKDNCPQQIIDRLDARGLAIWFMDDGSVSKNKNAMLHTCSFDQDSNLRLTEKLIKMGIECKTVFLKYKGKRAPGYWSIQISCKGYETLNDIVAPYIHPDLLYKMIGDSASKYQWNNKINEIMTYPVESVIKEKPQKKKGEGWGLFDLEIEDNHNYIVCGGDSRHGGRGSGVIAHNCHHAPAATWTDLLMKAENANHVYAFTATAFRADGLDMAIHSFAGPVVYSRDVRWGIQHEYLSNFHPFSISVQPRYHGGEKNGRPLVLGDNIQGTTAYKILGSSFEVFQVARDKLIRALEKGRKPIVIFKTVEACKKFRKFCEPLIDLDVASAQQGRKSKYPLRMFQEGKANYLLANSGLISEGIDCPYADCLIQCTQNSSDVMTLQILGRVLRKPEGKKDAVVIDITTGGFAQFVRAGERRNELYAKIVGENNLKKVTV